MNDQERIQEVTPSFYKSLGMIEDYAKYARRALNDEHEANFKYYVMRINDVASALQQEVEKM